MGLGTYTSLFLFLLVGKLGALVSLYRWAHSLGNVLTSCNTYFPVADCHCWWEAVPPRSPKTTLLCFGSAYQQGVHSASAGCWRRTVWCQYRRSHAQWWVVDMAPGVRTVRHMSGGGVAYAYRLRFFCSWPYCGPMAGALFSTVQADDLVTQHIYILNSVVF